MQCFHSSLPYLIVVRANKVATAHTKSVQKYYYLTREMSVTNFSRIQTDNPEFMLASDSTRESRYSICDRKTLLPILLNTSCCLHALLCTLACVYDHRYLRYPEPIPTCVRALSSREIAADRLPRASRFSWHLSALDQSEDRMTEWRHNAHAPLMTPKLMAWHPA